MNDADFPKIKRRRRGPAKSHAEQLEQSRRAAKRRRDEEQVELELLASMLPCDQNKLAKVDKSTLLCLVIAYLTTKNFVRSAMKEITNQVSNLSMINSEAVSAGTMKAEEGHMMMEALDGFLIFVGKNGRIAFVSEQVEKHLGLTVTEVMTMNMLELVHNEDQKQFLQQFDDQPDANQKSITSSPASMDCSDADDNVATPGAQRERVFYIRIGCLLAKPGSKSKHHGHILTQWSGRLQSRISASGGGLENNPPVGLVAVVRPLHSNPLVEIRLDGNMFVSRHDLGLRFTFCDPRILSLIGYNPEELMGKTTYQYHCPSDALKFQNCHSHLIAKGTCVSKYYRFLGKAGQWVWMKTRATIIYNSDNEPQYVVCLNYVYSEEEGKRCLLLEGENCDAGCGNDVQGYIDIQSLTSGNNATPKDATLIKNHQHQQQEPNNNYKVSGFTGCAQTSCGTPSVSSCSSTNAPPQIINNTTAHTNSVVVSEAVLDHTYPVNPPAHTSIPHCGDLPAGLAASGFTQFVQQDFVPEGVGYNSSSTPNVHGTSTTRDWSAWIDGLIASISIDVPVVAAPSVEGLSALSVNVDNTAMATTTTTTMVNRDYRLAVSDHDYSAKPESADNQNSRTHDVIFSNSDGLLLEGLDEMMDTDFLDTVSFGRTNYEDSQLLNGDGLLGGMINSKPSLGLTHDDLGDTNSLLEAIGDTNNDILQGLHHQPQSASLSLSEFPSNHMDHNGELSATDAFAAKFAQSLMDKEVNGVHYSLGQTDPCLGVTSLQHLATTTTTTLAKNGKRTSGLEQNLNQLTLGLVDTPPPSPKPIHRQGGKPNYLSMPRKSSSSTKSSPSTSPPHRDLSASYSGSSSYHKGTTSPSSSSPPHSRSLSKSWPNSSGGSGKPSRHRGAGSSAGGSRHRSSGGSSRTTSRSNSSEHNKNKGPPSLLEQFLTTKQRINPNRGSDNVFNRSRVTDRISKLQIGRQASMVAAEDDPNLLQQLLTGEIDGKRVHQYEQRIIKTRRHDGSENTTPVTSPLTSPLMSDVELDSDSLVTDATGLDTLFDSGTADMGSFFEPLSPDVDVLMHSDLDDILREQSRQEELWLRQYVS